MSLALTVCMVAFVLICCISLIYLLALFVEEALRNGPPKSIVWFCFLVLLVAEGLTRDLPKLNLGLLSLSGLLWLLDRGNKVDIGERDPSEYSNPDDALGAAGKLDQLGESDKAITIYSDALSRWPEHKKYIVNCLDEIKKKQGAHEC